MRDAIPLEKVRVKAHALFGRQWMLLASGDFASRDFNAMTIGWGSLGTMWGKSFVQVVVRPCRYTFEFMERYDSFTVSAFPDANRGALELLGSKSGRDGDKVSESGITPVASVKVGAPSFAEATLVFECQKIYWADFDPAHFLDPGIEKNYPAKDYHRAYFGEVLAVFGTPDFLG